ncbi:MAG TPA: hypothetical protein VNQ73_14225 [Ilumatobacter sp.]|nr:hypothetical protein [Ilumatobacter sp.]
MGPRVERNEFLPGPRWRTRAGKPALAVAVGATFAVIVLIGWAVLVVLIAGLDWLGVPAAWRHATWIAPTVGAVAWALRRPQPATASEDEAQPWSDYAVRAVMVGIEQPRPVAQRLLTGVLFGAPLVVYLIITVILEALGFF